VLAERWITVYLTIAVRVLWRQLRSGRFTSCWCVYLRGEDLLDRGMLLRGFSKDHVFCSCTCFVHVRVLFLYLLRLSCLPNSSSLVSRAYYSLLNDVLPLRSIVSATNTVEIG
jgi:hypothetical protein